MHASGNYTVAFKMSLMHLVRAIILFWKIDTVSEDDAILRQIEYCHLLRMTSLGVTFYLQLKLRI